jgi:hypothetical protein
MTVTSPRLAVMRGLAAANRPLAMHAGATRPVGQSTKLWLGLVCSTAQAHSAIRQCLLRLGQRR